MDKDKPAWDYKPSGGTAVDDQPATKSAAAAGEPPDSKSAFTWTASEFVEHERGAAWYLMLIVLTVIVAGLAYLLTKDYFALGTIVALGLIVGIAARNKPRQIQYTLDNKGLRVGEKYYRYSLFRSFSIVRDGPLSSLEFLPLKKLMFPPSAYFGPGDEERIMDVVGQHLPYEERKPDRVDRISRRLRF